MADDKMFSLDDDETGELTADDTLQLAYDSMMKTLHTVNAMLRVQADNPMPEYLAISSQLMFALASAQYLQEIRNDVREIKEIQIGLTE